MCCVPRSLDYGASFTNIEANLDPSVSDPILWLGYYISDFNKNMVSGTATVGLH